MPTCSLFVRNDTKETVPVALKTESVDQNKNNNPNLQENGKKLSLSTLPMLSADVDDVVLEFEDEDKKENAGMSLLMKVRLLLPTDFDVTALGQGRKLRQLGKLEECRDFPNVSCLTLRMLPLYQIGKQGKIFSKFRKYEQIFGDDIFQILKTRTKLSE